MAEEIDEDFLLASIGNKKEGKTIPTKEEPQTKEPPPKKRVKQNSTANENYEVDFLCRNEITERRSAYVSKEVHETIKLIVLQIGGMSNLSVGGYIDNVLKHHLEKYKDEINTLYKQSRSDLVK